MVIPLSSLQKILGILAVSSLMGVCSLDLQAEPIAPKTEDAVPSSLLSRWGIEVTSLRMTAAGRMIDFRFKVHDPEKAATLGKSKSKACLIDQTSGEKLVVPKTPKIGPLRQTAERLDRGKIYFIFFSNLGHKVKTGSKVTLEIGEFRAENLIVQ